MNSFFYSQFKFCPFIWLRHSCTNNRKIDRFHGKFLRIICNNKQLSLKKFLEKDNSVSIHEKIYKFQLLKCIRLAITSLPYEQNFWSKAWTFLQFKTKLSVCSTLVKSVYYGTESLSYLEPKVYDILPNILQKHKWLRKVQNGY